MLVLDLSRGFSEAELRNCFTIAEVCLLGRPRGSGIQKTRNSKLYVYQGGVLSNSTTAPEQSSKSDALQNIREKF